MAEQPSSQSSAQMRDVIRATSQSVRSGPPGQRRAAEGQWARSTLRYAVFERLSTTDRLVGETDQINVAAAVADDCRLYRVWDRSLRQWVALP